MWEVDAPEAINEIAFTVNSLPSNFDAPLILITKLSPFPSISARDAPDILKFESTTLPLISRSEAPDKLAFNSEISEFIFISEATP